MTSSVPERSDEPVDAKVDPAASPGATSSARTQDDEIIDAELVPDPIGATSVPTPAFDYTDAGVPTLDYLRSKVEGRLGTAHGSAELAEAEAVRSAADRAARLQREELTQAAREAQREQAAADRLAEIRKSMGR